jgi:hypothetical protein
MRAIEFARVDNRNGNTPRSLTYVDALNSLFEYQS